MPSGRGKEENYGSQDQCKAVFYGPDHHAGDGADHTVFFPASKKTYFNEADGDDTITFTIFSYLRSFNSVLISFGFCNLMVDMIFRYRNGSRFYLSDKEMKEIA